MDSMGMARIICGNDSSCCTIMRVPIPQCWCNSFSPKNTSQSFTTYRTPLLCLLSNYFTLRKLKVDLKGCWFEDIESVQQNVTAVLKAIPKQTSNRRRRAWQHMCNSYRCRGYILNNLNKFYFLELFFVFVKQSWNFIATHCILILGFVIRDVQNEKRDHPHLPHSLPSEVKFVKIIVISFRNFAKKIRNFFNQTSAAISVPWYLNRYKSSGRGRAPFNARVFLKIYKIECCKFRLEWVAKWGKGRIGETFWTAEKNLKYHTQKVNPHSSSTARIICFEHTYILKNYRRRQIFQYVCSNLYKTCKIRFWSWK